MSLLFLVVYGGCLWITAHRLEVGTFYFEWEHAIPFLPFMILPYLSIDLFFVAAPFLFTERGDLHRFVRRIVVTIVVAGLCFLSFPLRFGFPRPQAGGWLGALFDWFRSVDAPYNLFPSLHAALLLLLCDAHARNLRGWARAGVLGWFALIALSPLLTHQHHMIDILGGLALAALVSFATRRKICLDPNERAS